MPPFEYHGYTSPYVQSISALLQAPGQIEAQRAQTTGNAWANAAQQTGQAVSGAIQQATDPRRKLEAAQLIEAQQKIAAGQRAVSDQSAIDTAMSPSHPMGPPEQGAPQQMPTRDAILNALPGHLRGVVQKQFDDTDKNRAEVQKARNDYLTSMTEHLAGLRYNLEYWKGDPTVAKLSLDDAKQTYANDPEMLRHIASAEQAMAADPTPANILKIAGTLPTTEKYAALSKKPEGKTREIRTRNADGSEQIKIVEDTPGFSATSAAPQKDPKGQVIATTGANGQKIEKFYTDEQLTAGVPGYIAPEKGDKAPDQNKLEQQYRTVLMREVSSRSGTLGTEDSKVASANHLMEMFHQSYDPKTGEYNIPKVQQTELALGLARMMSPNGQVGIQLEQEINQATAKGDLNKALTYITGQPFNGSTQAVYKLFKDSIERQGQVAVDNRQAAIKYLQGLAPTELEPSRREALEANTLAPLRQLRLAKGPDGQGKLWMSSDGGKTWK